MQRVLSCKVVSVIIEANLIWSLIIHTNIRKDLCMNKHHILLLLLKLSSHDLGSDPESQERWLAFYHGLYSCIVNFQSKIASTRSNLRHVVLQNSLGGMPQTPLQVHAKCFVYYAGQSYTLSIPALNSTVHDMYMKYSA